MKKVSSLLIIATLVIAHSCKQEESDRFKYLTGTVWTPVSLLANGVDATGPDGILAGFVGDAKFNEDGTGTFGTYSGEWMFASAEEKLSITSMSPPVSLILNIIELTETSLKLQGSIPTNPPISIEMTFTAK